MNSSSSSWKSNDCKFSSASFSSSSNKNGGKKRRRKERRKKIQAEDAKNKRAWFESSYGDATSNTPSPPQDDTKRFGCASSLHDLLKSDLENQKLHQDSGRKEMKDTVMADETSKSAALPFGQEVSFWSTSKFSPFSHISAYLLINKEYNFENRHNWLSSSLS